MARNVSRLLPLVRWQYLRLGLLIAALPLALWACNSHPLKEPLPNPQMETDFSILVSPERQVDILFMVDNSPSMDPKQKALAANFPLMIQQLQNLPDGLPDVHIGVISSDMGAGSDSVGVNCARVLGDKGLLWGNDPNSDLASIAPGKPQANDATTHPVITDGCGLDSGARWIVDIGNATGIGRTQNYKNKSLTDVFSCLATAVGTQGCGYEHQLQSIRVALNPQDGVNMENAGFVRPNAYLAIVIITDEDDCSADPSDASNDSMFLQNQNPITETASLKCAARGHICNGQDIPDYADPAVGYTGTGFSTPFANCAPKEPSNLTPPAAAAHEMPLIGVQAMIDSVNGVPGFATDSSGNLIYTTDKSGKKIYTTVPKPIEKILVSGIIGWLPEQKLDGVDTVDQYRIGKDATSRPLPYDTYWDYMPICSVPGAAQDKQGNIYKAYGGLRLKKFLDAFKTQKDAQGNVVPNVFSICNSNFTDAMTQIGNAIVNVLKPGCVPYKLIDTDPNTPDTQPQCQVTDRTSCDTPGQGDCPVVGYKETSLIECVDGSNKPLSPANPNLGSVPNDDAHRPCWYLVYDADPASGCPAAPDHQRITALRKDDAKAPAGTRLAMKCLTCAKADGICAPWIPGQ